MSATLTNWPAFRDELDKTPRAEVRKLLRRYGLLTSVVPTKLRRKAGYDLWGRRMAGDWYEAVYLKSCGGEWVIHVETAGTASLCSG